MREFTAEAQRTQREAEMEPGMPRGTVKRVIVLVLAMAISSAFVVVVRQMLNKEYEKELLPNYVLFKTSRRTITVCCHESRIPESRRPQRGVLVNSYVEQVAVVAPYIVGKAVMPEGDEGVTETQLGYFAIDTGTGTVSKGMSKFELEIWLQRVGIVMNDIRFVHPDSW